MPRMGERFQDTMRDDGEKGLDVLQEEGHVRTSVSSQKQ